jgi:hypothetical protein
VDEPTVMSVECISYEIPIAVKIAIADALINFAKMEAAAEALVWKLTGAPYPDGKTLAPTDTTQKFAAAELLVERHLGEIALRLLPDDFWMAARELCVSRDQIVHGFWLMVDRTVPVAAPFRPKGHKGPLPGERFTIERLKAISEECDRGRSYLEGLIDACVARERRTHPPTSAVVG